MFEQMARGIAVTTSSVNIRAKMVARRLLPRYPKALNKFMASASSVIHLTALAGYYDDV